MNSIVAFVFAFLACANAGAYIAAPSAKIIQGPSSRTTVAGPDGSVISSVQPGGTIIAEDHGVVAAAPALAYAAPAYSYAAPTLSYAAPSLSYAAPALSYAAPAAYSTGYVAQKALDTVVAGPSGTIATSKTVAAPAVFAHSAPLAYGYYY